MDRANPEKAVGSGRLSPATLRWCRATAIAAAVIFAYFAATNHVDLTPWNNLADAGSQWPSTLMGAIPAGLLVVAFGLWQIRVLVIFAWGYAWVWLGLQIYQWWPAYLTGANASWYTDGGYDETLRWFPRIGSNPVVIDAQHTVLQTGSLLVAVLATVATVKIVQDSRAPTPERARA
ncbi:MAG TPA: hypothetical protein VK053_00600 [Jiangellaceae bacterium]|nr:hypothetical protein [Jiangellaceae bacterium]